MRDVDGRTQGLKQNQIRRLEAIFRRRIKGAALLTPELARTLSELSHELNRQVGVMIDRGGEIRRVIVGEASRLYLPDIGRARVGQSRLRGLRLIRTELRQQGVTSEDLADLAKLRLDAVVVIELDPSGAGSRAAYWAHLAVTRDARDKPCVVPQTLECANVQALPEDALETVAATESEMARVFGGEARKVVRDTALLVGVWKNGRKIRRQAEDSMRELEQLAKTDGVKVIETIIQYRRQLDPRTVVGKGKIEELSLRALELGAEVLIFDRDLAPSQLRAITNGTDLKVLDRTQLILDIFAQRATSRDGKLQVELAQLKYTLPRLIEKSTAMSRLAGGIGGQGPGETKLEIHRRRARNRINQLEKQIGKLSVQRGERRKRRKASRIPLVSIVGYTNAGKSTLLNAVTNASVLAEDQLFATLDPTSRRVRFPAEREIVLTDTVGFIRDLPKDLVAAFKATLEELEESDLILHVIDGADHNVDDKMRAVETIAEELGVHDVPTIIVINKIDAAAPLMVSALKRATKGIPVSAVNREGFPELMDAIESTVFDARLQRLA